MWTIRSYRNSDAVYTKIAFIRLHIALSAPMQVVQASTSVGLCLVYSTPPGWREGSSSASPLGRYAAAASLSQETQTQTGSHIHLMCVCVWGWGGEGGGGRRVEGVGKEGRGVWEEEGGGGGGRRVGGCGKKRVEEGEEGGGGGRRVEGMGGGG